MVKKQCFYRNCSFEVEIACHCTSPYTYSCENHWGMHIKSHKKDHPFDLDFTQTVEETKEAALKFLAKEISKKDKSKEKILASFSQNLSSSEDNVRELLKELDSDSKEISNHIDKIFKTKKILKSEQDPILRLLTLSPAEAINNLSAIIPKRQESYNSVKLFCGMSKGIEKMVRSFIKDKFETILNERLIEIEKKIEHTDKKNKESMSEVRSSMLIIKNEAEKTKNELEKWKEDIKEHTENEIGMLNAKMLSIAEDIGKYIKNLTEFCKSIPNCIDENKERALNEAFIQDYENYSVANLPSSPLLLINKNNYHEANLLVYDTESESEDMKDLATQETLDYGTCIAKLPNNEIFCFGNASPISGISAIIDQDYRVWLLAPGTPCCYSSALYFDKNIYCFGGENNGLSLTLSEKFDLEENKWNKLKPLPQPDEYCHSITFDGDILISGCYNNNILRYWTKTNHFTRIDYEFSYLKRKILISVDRLYLIECNGMIYESEIGDENTWKKIGKSIISSGRPCQVNCQYSKGMIYIGTKMLNMHKYYKFNLKRKFMFELRK